MPLKASIDIGTNSTRLLIVDMRQDGTLNPVEHHERITKLGEGLSENNELQSNAIDRVLAALVEYQQVIHDYEIDDIRLLATSATRDAQNRDIFLQHITKKTGLDCRVLSGDEEAYLSFLGVLSDYKGENFIVCDVGGGSSEIIIAAAKKLQFAKSLNIGSSRMTQKFLHSDPPLKSQVSALGGFVQVELHTNFLSADMQREIVAVGGTAASLALIDSSTSEHMSYKVHHYALTSNRLEKIITELAEKNIDSRRSIIGLHPKRADVILAGALIFAEIMQFCQQDCMTISLRDLLFGVFLEER
ncbi:Ppx/GppA family phosphatase [candidate division KSB1 bacterium]|nr:Ppx/GppA family phosphatase [candidate division KSB1 bacterium]RQW01807.1 MAG: Ppx/GppA family phosphatase [candidate division KSB1 bacterium]